MSKCLAMTEDTVSGFPGQPARPGIRLPEGAAIMRSRTRARLRNCRYYQSVPSIISHGS